MTDIGAPERLVLRADVLLWRAAELPPGLRKLLRVSDQHMLVARPGARTPSKLLDPAAGDLLEEFRRPSTVADAVRRSCSRLKLRSEAVSDKASAFLYHMFAAGFLVHSSETGKEDVPSPLACGATLGTYQVLSLLHLMEDTEIYMVAGADRPVAVLKAARKPRSWAHRRLRHEASILNMVGGRPSPRLLESVLDAERPYLVLEQCHGINAALAADGFRRTGGVGSPRQIVEVCCRVLDAYASLHERRVLHGDVHPANVLVNPQTGDVRLVDFGLARLLYAEGPPNPAERAGDPRFYEPEYAQALLAGRPLPPATLSGEQYSLAVLLYRMLTGHHYLPPELEQSALLRRITTDDPLPFPPPLLSGWTSIEGTLRRALEKDAENRFPSVRIMADSLRTALRTAPAAIESRRGGQRQQPLLLGSILEPYSKTGSITMGLTPPAASVNFGAAGVAYCCYRASLVLQRPDLLAAADKWLDRAKATSAAGADIYAPKLGITPSTVGRSSLYHGAPGISCVEGLLWCAWGNPNLALRAAHVLAEVYRPDDRLDLTTGSAGLLLGCAILYEALSPYRLRQTRLVAAAGRLLDHLWASPRPLTQSLVPNAPPFLGIAHGWAGVLYATIRWAAASGERIPPAAADRLDEMATLAIRDRGMARWPRTAGGDESWPGWCHGSAGHAHLWALANAVGGDGHHLKLAQEAAEDAWLRQHHLGHLCCGSAGQAYAMLALYQSTGDGRWVERARALLRHALAQLGSPTIRPGSLYAGDVGVALLEADLRQPGTAAMPLFAPEGWLSMRASGTAGDRTALRPRQKRSVL